MNMCPYESSLCFIQEIGKSEQAFKANSNSPRDMESNTFWTCWKTSSAEDSAGTYRDTSTRGRINIVLLESINIGNAETITRGGSVQQSINETQRQVLGVDQYNSRIRSIHHKQILTTTVRHANRTWALSTYPAVSGILFPRLYISPLN